MSFTEINISRLKETKAVRKSKGKKKGWLDENNIVLFTIWQ